MKKHNRRFLIFLSLSVIWMAFIYLQSALSAELSSMESGWLADLVSRLFLTDRETASFIVRKTAHFLEYTILGALLSLTFRELFTEKKRRVFPAFLIGLGIGILYAAADEFHQTFVSGRSGELRDVLIDMGGVLTGTLLTALIAFLVQRKKQRKAAGESRGA